MMKIVKEKMPLSANFFLNSIEAFQRRFVDTKITDCLSNFAPTFRLAHRLLLTKTVCCGVKEGLKSKIKRYVVRGVGAFTFLWAISINTCSLMLGKYLPKPLGSTKHL